jgi:hypothetical protein
VVIEDVVKAEFLRNFKDLIPTMGIPENEFRKE